MHSLSLPRHEYKRFGEIDFIVCGPGALFVLEVKGGGVACRDGVWETTNRYGETERLRESPFKQAETALHGLRSKLPANFASAFVVGYGVVTPDVDRLPVSAEWDKATLADGRDFRRFESWLERLIQYWRGKDPRRAAASAEKLRAFQQYLRPSFEAVMPLHAVVGSVEEQVVRVTADQMRLLDIVAANHRVICRGGAGTGKTMLAIELARRWTASGERVVLACQSPWLKHYLSCSVVPGLNIALSRSIHMAAARVGVDRFDAMIVDEGQDLLDMDTLSLLDQHVKGGLRDGRWCFFHDANNQSGLCGTYAPDAYDYLKSFDATLVPLHTNCRNTLPILRLIQTSLNADVGTSGVGDGPEVRITHVSEDDDAAAVLANELAFLVDGESFNLNDIVLLSSMPFDQSCAARLPEAWRNRISVLDEASSRNAARHKIGFAKIYDFKGLESEIVVLIDLPPVDVGGVFRPLQYVGMSRARALLSIVNVPTTKVPRAESQVE